MANLIYQNDGTALVWTSSGGDELISLQDLATDTGRQGAYHDFTAAARAREWAWRAYIQFKTAPTVGDIVEIWWVSSDGTHPDNDDGTGDIAVSHIDKLANLTPLGVIVVDEAAINIPMRASGIIDVIHQWGAPVFWNTSTALHATGTNCGFKMTPIPFEVQ